MLVRWKFFLEIFLNWEFFLQVFWRDQVKGKFLALFETGKVFVKPVTECRIAWGVWNIFGLVTDEKSCDFFWI